MKTVFTTGEAAKICKVSQQTIIRCFDNGQLKGFRVPGSSKFRRIPRDHALQVHEGQRHSDRCPRDRASRKVLLVDDDDQELVEITARSSWKKTADSM